MALARGDRRVHFSPKRGSEFVGNRNTSGVWKRSEASGFAGRIPSLRSQELRNEHQMKKLIVFDLDGTLAESKSSLDAEMSTLLRDLLGIVKVAVISGADWPQFETQVLSHLPHDPLLAGLSLLPTCGTKFFQYSGDWKKIYSEDFTSDEKEKII